MTRLTKYQKSAIVDRVLADIPIKLTKASIADKLVQLAVDELPKEIRRIWDNEQTRPYVKLVHVGHGPVYTWVPGCDNRGGAELFGDEKWKSFKDLTMAHRAELNRRSELRIELEANFMSVKTRKQFIERFPELEKYLPDEEAPVNNPPATTHMIDKLRNLGLKL